MSRAVTIGLVGLTVAGLGGLAFVGVTALVGIGAVSAIASARSTVQGEEPFAASVTTGTPTAEDPCPGGCITFALNIHDIGHVAESGATVMHAIDIWTSHGVKGELYFTGGMAEHYAKELPEVVARIKQTGMTVSYHVRPPHPLYAGFDSRLKALSDADLATTVMDYETYALNRSTGDIDRSRPGGYALVRDTFGSAPVTVSAMTDDKRLKKAALAAYKSMGAKAALFYHEEGAPLEYPLETREGLVVRPSDFSVTRWDDGRGHEPFWWARVLRDPNYNPLAHLKSELGSWTQPRGAFVTVLMHENDCMRQDAPSWTYSYFPDANNKAPPLPAPWTVDGPDRTHTRSPEERAAIWAAYDEMVGWAAANMHVVTDADIINMPQKAR